ncbi:MAG: hypothetical protein ACLSG5_00370 [Oscillospiraceae bacterium]
MAKLSKTTKTVIIAAAVLLVLGAVLLVLVMTSPKDSGSSGTPPLFPGGRTSESSAAADDGSSASSGYEKIVINSCEQENVLKLEAPTRPAASRSTALPGGFFHGRRRQRQHRHAVLLDKPGA